MSFLRYPKYKDSGVEWLGEVPEGWDVTKLKRLASLQSGDFITGVSIQENGVYPVYGGNGLRGYCDTFTHDGFYALVGRQGALCGNVNYADGKFWASEHAVVVSPYQPTSVLWLGELLSAMNLGQYSISSAQPGLSVERIGDLRIPIPPEIERRSIAAFLDRETGKIDALIGAQRRLIELLREKRQAVISHAVTKGLDPDAPMKDSGVEWLGMVPDEWGVSCIRRIFEICKRIAGEEGYDILSITQRGIQIKNIESGDGQLSMDYSKYQIVDVGDFAMNHMDLLTGYVDVSPFFGVTSPDYRVFRFKKEKSFSAKFFLYIFQNAYKQKIFFPYGQGSAQLGRWRLPADEFNSFSLPVPPLPEQKVIAAFLDRETAKMDDLITKAEQAITLLQERRSALISSVVTGKIDTRGEIQ
ncbi:restriction endonuclease subunit S [Acidithiobacillus sp. IBUN Pt1247-S3]|uniref:restriction endonuclease subunit S n=1 Tax=Acidithiobacillus sp. IBUN Pt1247-S3 TaxID=3166642 RepID=UPI0034E3E31E